jgi:hypothetical protein
MKWDELPDRNGPARPCQPSVLHGSSRADALWLRGKSQQQSLASPYFRAPFVLIGE